MPVLTRPISIADPALALVGAHAAADKKATDPVILNVGGFLAIADYFLIASAANDRLVRAICDEIEERVKAAGGGSPKAVEGLDDARWVLMDYGDWIAHVFLEEAREFYDLERLWGDAPRVDVEIVPAVAATVVDA